MLPRINNKRKRLSQVSNDRRSTLSLASQRKGVSLMVGYVLLITLAIVMGIVAYNWMKTYLPRDAAECPEGVSVFIKEYKCSNDQLNLTLKNNGRFDIEGYLIRVGNTTEAVATRDLTAGLRNLSSGEIIANGIIAYLGGENFLKAGDERTSVFDDIISMDGINLIEITPVRLQKEGNREKLMICTNSILKDALSSCTL
jgi:hypothetical protein